MTYKIATAAIMALALVGCQKKQPDKTSDLNDNPTYAPLKVVMNGSTHNTDLVKICDEGRAVYVSDTLHGGGVAVVGDARECIQ